LTWLLNELNDGMTEQKSRYNRFHDDLSRRFGARVYKIALDAGMGCPNRDGTSGDKGCLFCDPLGGSGRAMQASHLSLTEQIRRGKEGLRRRYGAEKFIAYFQTFSNTYASPDTLRKLFDEGTADSEIVGLSIATRPDCLSPQILDLIAEYNRRLEVWIELGVQSMNEKSLLMIERGHGVKAIRDAAAGIKSRSIRLCAHLILGIPGEDPADMASTAREVSGLQVDAVKFHMLYVTRGSRLYQEYRAGKVPLLTREQYVDAVIMMLELLSPAIVIQRLVSEAHPSQLIAPDWLKDKSGIIRDIERRLEEKKTFQGRLQG